MAGYKNVASDPVMFLQNLNEKLFLELWRDLGREVLEKNLGAVPTNRRKKKLHDSGSNRN